MALQGTEGQVFDQLLLDAQVIGQDIGAAQVVRVVVADVAFADGGYSLIAQEDVALASTVVFFVE